MKQIQVDMFAVGLGAAVLTQVLLGDGSSVTLLADGGIGPGYLADHVWKRLDAAFDHFKQKRNRRIDLIIGTHYDGDHLKGLLPIVQDESIEIGEVWLPPLSNDTDRPLGSKDFLAEQFFDDKSGQVVLSYLEDKANQVDELFRLEDLAFDHLVSRELEPQQWRALPRFNEEPQRRERITRRSDQGADTIQDQIERFRAFFEKHESDAARRTDDCLAHESAIYDSRYLDPLAIARLVRYPWPLDEGFNGKTLSNLMKDNPERARILPAALAGIRKSAAAGAITATHLAYVAAALRGRNQSVRPTSNFIALGRPSRFVWTPSKQKFVSRAEGGETDLVLNLLGPSEDLVAKHREKLPVGAYFHSLMYDQRINLKDITASNQLSYIFILETLGQRILISGDAGCYGFKDSGNKYYKDLLKWMAPLHVVQIAHHAGRNYDFYNVLLEAGFGEQEEPALLLLSHAKHDKYRPSPDFRLFVESIRGQREDPSLLFTSEPDPSKVEGYQDLIHEAVPKGPGQQEGDIRLAYLTDDPPGWTVELHAISK